MKLNFSRRFEKQRAKSLKSAKHKLNERLRLFTADSFHPLLENHPLHGMYAGCRSINITGDYRAIYYYENLDIVRFIAVGTHHELFGT
ncbi:type II toxin-antitoxin system RelE/ParE family toxin [Candidatus Kaiserbacteria bacterium]|nr:type II toxin-antitoxin system RelE/ParE family toxin [Candidatus Kaiserbacteria bacterium]